MSIIDNTDFIMFNTFEFTFDEKYTNIAFVCPIAIAENVKPEETEKMPEIVINTNIKSDSDIVLNKPIINDEDLCVYDPYNIYSSVKTEEMSNTDTDTDTDSEINIRKSNEPTGLSYVIGNDNIFKDILQEFSTKDKKFIYGFDFVTPIFLYTTCMENGTLKIIIMDKQIPLNGENNTYIMPFQPIEVN